MLSKKMAFSLTSLITILAFAFVVTPVMAGDFSTSISAELTTAVSDVNSNDVSHADGVQLHKTSVDAVPAVTLKVAFGQVVALTTSQAQAEAEIFASNDVKVQTYTMDGALTGTAVTVGSPALGIPADGKNFTVALTAFDSATYQAHIQIAKGAVGAASAGVGDNDDANEKKELWITFLNPNPSTAPAAGPDVLKVARVGEPFATVTSAEFMVHMLLSEEPKGGFTKDHLALTELDFGSIVKLASPANQPAIPAVDRNGDGDTTDTEPYETAIPATTDGTISAASWRDGMLHLYLVTLKTKPGEKTAVVGIKSFAGMENPAPGEPQEMYNMLSGEGRDKLTVKTKTDPGNVPKTAGVKFGLPKEKYIPAGGYLVVAEDKAGSSVHVPPGEIKEAPKPHERTPAEMMYNVIDDGDLPNLETHLANGGTIGVMGPHALMITEIMWGSDASLDDPGKSQWIELYNAGAGYQTQDGDNTTYLVFYGPGEAPATGLHDLVGTVDDTAGYWSLAGKGQSGRTAEKIAGEAVAETVTSPIISMNRVMTAGVLAKGTLASSWVQSVPPSSNFEANRLGVHIGSPGAMPVTYPAPPEPAPEPVVTPPTPVADAMDIMITEIMVDTGNGRLPQWIELNNVSGAAVSLAGWSVEIENDPADAAAIGSDIEIQLSGTLGVSAHEGNMGQGNSLLLVSRTARSSSNLDGNKNIVDVSGTVGARGHYKLISDIAFMITLVPPQKTGVFTPGDMAGNLGASPAWEIPMNEDGRSSLIRHEMDAAGMATMGTDANGWVLASGTDLVSGPATWYGSDEDAGTPGYDAGGPLPVELSHFRPARDKATGAVVITWATQSELNNAGFFIKRSQQRDGEFQVINATMIAGAGTTSEKQTYTFTDTTAQPNIVYYYQIEDVSLDGNRQTLTRGIRLKGHIGAAGKLTSTWGEIKASNE